MGRRNGDTRLRALRIARWIARDRVPRGHPGFSSDDALAVPRPPSLSPQKRPEKEKPMTQDVALPGMEDAPHSAYAGALYGAGITEIETRKAIEEIEQVAEITGAKRAVKQLCLSLAMSIDKGNLKGRAIANEAAQLFAMMQQLAPPEETGPDDSNLTPELRNLLAVFAAPAQLDAAPQGDGA